MDIHDVRRKNLAEILKTIPQAELSRRSKIAASYIHRCLLDPSDPNHKNIGELTARRIESGASLQKGSLDATGARKGQVAISQADDVLITQYEASGGMGGGRVMAKERPGVIRSWRVDSAWLRANVKSHTKDENLCIVTGYGPSMRPMFNPGDPLLVDTGVTTCDHEAVYFFRVSDEFFIKMLQRIPTEKGLVYRAKSKNQDYDPFDITENMDFQVIGKVLKVWCSDDF